MDQEAVDINVILISVYIDINNPLANFSYSKNKQNPCEAEQQGAQCVKR